MRLATFALLPLLLAGAAGAQTATTTDSGTGTYVSITGAYTFPNQFSTDVGVTGDLDDGYAITGAVGRRFGPVRGEVEAGWRENNIGQANGFGLTVPGEGSVSALSAMANVYFDPAFNLGPFQPYVGGGIGVARFRANDVVAIGVPGAGPVSASKTGFAWQLMAGVGYKVSDTATLTAGYRYFATPDVEADIPGVQRVEVDGLSLHAVEVGLRFNF